MSQKVVLERVTLDGAKPFTGHADRHDPESERLYARSGGQAMDWLCDAWRYRFNQLRSNRCKYGKGKTLVPIGGEPDTRSVSRSRSEMFLAGGGAVPHIGVTDTNRTGRMVHRRATTQDPAKQTVEAGTNAPVQIIQA